MGDEACYFWSKREYWSENDILNIYFGGLENLTNIDAKEVKNVRIKINHAVAAGEITIRPGDTPFKRDDFLKWAKNHLPNFPFQSDNFEPVIKKHHPGSKTEETQLRVIGALAILLAEKSNKLKVANKPNQSQIVSAALETLDHLQEHDLNRSGLKPARFRAFVKQGVGQLFNS